MHSTLQVDKKFTFHLVDRRLLVVINNTSVKSWPPLPLCSFSFPSILEWGSDSFTVRALHLLATCWLSIDRMLVSTRSLVTAFTSWPFLSERKLKFHDKLSLHALALGLSGCCQLAKSIEPLILARLDPDYCFFTSFWSYLAWFCCI